MDYETVIKHIRNAVWKGESMPTEALLIAESCIHKRLPKLPATVIKNGVHYKCSICGELIPISKQGYCYGCGQKILWKEI